MSHSSSDSSYFETEDRAYEPSFYSNVNIAEWQECEIYFFVNPTSGGNAAMGFTSAGLEEGKMKLPHKDAFIQIDFKIFDIRKGSSGSKPGFLKLKESQIASKNLITCACGGDGTVCWMTSEMTAHEIDDSNICYAVIPYGTGNDFARAFLWENYNAMQPFDRNFASIRQLFQDWFSSKLSLMDIWSVTLELHDKGGKLTQITTLPDGSRQKSILKDGEGNTLKRREWKMFNYFSIGIDARIGIGFDRNRTTSQVKNKVVYVNEGMKKMLMKNIPTNEWVDTMYDGNDIVFGVDSEVKLLNTHSLLASNVPSFAAGKDVWASARRTGFHIKKKVDLSPAHRQLGLAPQKMGDEILEWVMFKHKSSIGLEQVTPGHARRVHRGPGEFILSMKQRDVEDRCYFQIDGEFYQANAPDTFKVNHYKQVKVLVNSQRVLDPRKYIEV